MAAVIFTNLAGFSLGVPSDESGMNISKVNFKRSAEKIEVRKRAGGFAGRIDHSGKWMGTYSGELKGAWTGFIGQLITVANAAAFGITGGAWVVDDFTIDAENTKIPTVSVTVTGYDEDDIPAAATQTGAPTTVPSYADTGTTT